MGWAIGFLVLVVIVAAVVIGRLVASGGLAFARHTSDSWRQGRERIKTHLRPGMCHWCRDEPAREGSDYCCDEHELEDDWVHNA